MAWLLILAPLVLCVPASMICAVATAVFPRISGEPLTVSFIISSVTGWLCCIVVYKAMQGKHAEANKRDAALLSWYQKFSDQATTSAAERMALEDIYST